MQNAMKEDVKKIMLNMRRGMSAVRAIIARHKKDKMLISACMAVLLVVILVTTLFLQSTVKKPNVDTAKDQQVLLQTKDLHTKLSHISLEIAAVQRKLKSGDKNNMEQVNTTLMALSNEVKTIADSSNTIIEKAIEINTHKLQEQLGSIETQLTEIKGNKAKVDMVGADQLGFDVVDIFNMAHENIVSVRYGAHTVPLIVGESLAGWKLVHVSFNDQKAEFANEHNQHVIINLNTQKA